MTAKPFDRAAWLEWRRGGIGSSDIAAIVGLSPWATPYAVWAEKTGRHTADQGDDVVQEFGRRAEPMIAPWFGEVTGYRARKWQHQAVHRKWPVARATLDALVFRAPRSAAPIGVLELKTSGWQRDWDELPDQYQCQVQWQLEVMDLDRGWVAALHGRRLAVYPVDRNPEDGAWLIDQARRFWRDHVQADVPPAVDGHWATTQALAGLRRTEGAEADITDTLPTIQQLARARGDARAAKARQTELENEVKAALGDGEIGLIHGQPACTYLTRQRKGYTVEPTSYRALHITWKDPAA